MSKRDVFSNRRQFLKSSVVAGASVGGVISASSASAQNQEAGFLEVDPWTKTQGSTFVNPPYGLPSKYEKNVVRLLPSPAPTFLTGSRTPLQSLHGIITPNGLVFERHHAGVPDINPDLHKLVVHGMVDRPKSFGVGKIRRLHQIKF